MKPRAARPHIVQYWHDPDVPPDVEALIDTFRKQNPDLRHFLFSKEEAEEFISQHFAERELAAFRACAVPAMQADYFRYCATFVLGGIYADVDYRCMQKLDSMFSQTTGGLLFGAFGQRRSILLNGFFYFSHSEHPLPRLAVAVATRNIERRTINRVSVATGPLLLTGLLMIRRLGSFGAAWRLLAERHSDPPNPYQEEIHQLLSSVEKEIGNLHQIVDAFDDVHIDAYKKLISKWIRDPAKPLEYKKSMAHWSNWQRHRGKIYSTLANGE